MTKSRGLRGLLRDPVYLWVWATGTVGGIARWLEMLVLGIFAFEVTGSPFLVALLVILRMMPLAIFGSVVGTIADRLPPQRFLLASLVFATLLSATLFLLLLFGVARYWHVAVAAFLSGQVWATDMPLRRRILGDVAGPARLAPAMSFDSATNNGTRMLGPLLGGIIYQLLGTSGAFALSTILYALGTAFITLVPATVSTGHLAARSSRIMGDFRAAFRFVANNGDVLRILLVTVVFNVWGFPFVAMIPVIGADTLNLSASGIGGLAAMEGAGAFVGSMTIAVIAPATGFRRIYYFGALALLILVFVAGWVTQPLSFAALLLCIGFAGAGFYTMQSTLIYSVAPPEMRGRLFGVLVICIGTGLIGFTNIGLMGEWFGGTAAIRIIAAEGLIPLVVIGIGWRRLWHLRAGARPSLRPPVAEQP